VAAPIGDYEITPHAAFEMARRRVAENVVDAVLAAPQQRYAVGPGRDVLQSKLRFSGKTYLVRVFVDTEVVTVYRTNQIRRYWRAGR
jgi:hypothetical protein